MSAAPPSALPAGSRVAVIGSGVSGLVAAHVLRDRHRVTLFEADSRLGGHADTHDVRVGDAVIPVDTGFIVHNDRTYPTLLRLFDELGIPTQQTRMSMSVRVAETGVEYAGAKGLAGVFAQPRNTLSPRHLRLLWDIGRFHRAARAVLAHPEDTATGDEPLSAFLDRVGLGAHFRSHFMTPLVACVWSCDADRAQEYPARHLFTFLEHHGMLGVLGSPAWRTVTGGSRRYVRAVADGLPDVRLSTPVLAIEEQLDGVRLRTATDDDLYDAAVVATHPHQALRMLTSPTPAQTDVLSAITYSPNRALLHTDASVLPRSPDARASWNYLARGAGPVTVTYDLTRLQRICGIGDTRILVTLGGEDLIDPRAVIDEMNYEHPLYTPDSVAAIRRLPEVSTGRVAFAGAYHGWGFHEDGALSGVRAAEHLGVAWQARPAAAEVPA